MGEMQVLLYTEKNQRGHRQKHLQALHSLLVETQWFLALLGSRAIAKMANMHRIPRLSEEPRRAIAIIGIRIQPT